MVSVPLSPREALCLAAVQRRVPLVHIVCATCGFRWKSELWIPRHVSFRESSFRSYLSFSRILTHACTFLHLQEIVGVQIAWCFSFSEASLTEIRRNREC